MKFKVKKLSDNGIIPTRADNDSAGYDLYSAEDVVITTGQRKLIKTDIAIHQEKGWFGQIEGRSGLAYKKGIAVLGGIIDSSFSGNIGVILLNTQEHAGITDKDGEYLSIKEYKVAQEERSLIIKKGDRIAQIIFQQYGAPELIEVDELEKTERNEKGYGSSGK